MKENPLLDKLFAFALRIVKLNRYLNEEKKEFVLSKELLVSGTHIGKHIKVALDGESHQIFAAEMADARRKTLETEYWLQLLFQADFPTEKAFKSIESDRMEIFKLLSSNVKTSDENV